MEYTYAIQSCCARLSHGSTMHIAVTWRTKNTVAHMFPGVNCNNSSSSVLMINEFAQVSLYWIVNWKKKRKKRKINRVRERFTKSTSKNNIFSQRHYRRSRNHLERSTRGGSTRNVLVVRRVCKRNRTAVTPDTWYTVSLFHPPKEKRWTSSLIGVHRSD